MVTKPFTQAAAGRSKKTAAAGRGDLKAPAATKAQSPLYEEHLSLQGEGAPVKTRGTSKKTGLVTGQTRRAQDMRQTNGLKSAPSNLRVSKKGAPSKDASQTSASQTPTAFGWTGTKPVSHFEWGLLFLGLFCVVAGFGLIIAANWFMIPGSVKLTGSLTLLGAALFGVYQAKERKKPLILEVAVFLAFMMIGANIALVQQVYHLVISFSNGALLWAGLATFLLFFTKKRVVPLAWCALVLFGLYDYLIDVFDIVGYKGVAGFFFLTYLLSFLGEKGLAQMVRGASIVMMIIIVFLGDMGAFSDSFSPLGMLLTIVLMGLLAQANALQKPVRFFNIVLLYVAARVLMLFFAAYASLFHTGVVLIGFGVLILLIGALYYFKRDDILKLIEKGFNR